MNKDLFPLHHILRQISRALIWFRVNKYNLTVGSSSVKFSRGFGPNYWPGFKYGLMSTKASGIFQCLVFDTRLKQSGKLIRQRGLTHCATIILLLASVSQSLLSYYVTYKIFEYYRQLLFRKP